MKHGSSRLFAAILITACLLVGTAATATIGSQYPMLIPVG